jgi:hypothetical protein
MLSPSHPLRAPTVGVFQFSSASMEAEKQLFLSSCGSFSAPGGDMEYHEATQLHNKYHLDEFILLFSSLSTIFLFCYISLFGFYIYFDVFVKEKVVGFNGEGK